MNCECNDLGLEIRADKCVSMVHVGTSLYEVKKDVAIKIGVGLTRSVTDGAAKVLGCLFDTSSQVSSHQKGAGKVLLESFSEKLTNLDKTLIRGECKP